MNATELRHARSEHPWCWACDARASRVWCDYCGAPPWGGNVTDDLPDSAGVYVLESNVGLVKIGVTRISILERTNLLTTQARRNGAYCQVAAALPGAGSEVELWLHKVLLDTRDRNRARDEGLPCTSEWFWRTPAIDALIADEPIAEWIRPELWCEPDVTGPDDSRFFEVAA